MINNVFVFAGDNRGANWFRVTSNYGTDGNGRSRVYTLRWRGYKCFSLKVFGTTDPSVNKLIIVR